MTNLPSSFESSGPNISALSANDPVMFLNFKACFSALVSSENGTTLTYFLYSFDEGTVFICAIDYLHDDVLLRRGIQACQGRLVYTVPHDDFARKSTPSVIVNFFTKNVAVSLPKSLQHLYSMIRCQQNFFLPEGFLDAFHGEISRSHFYQLANVKRALLDTLMANRILLNDVAELYSSATLNIASLGEKGGRNHKFILGVKEESMKRPASVMTVGNKKPEVNISINFLPRQDVSINSCTEFTPPATSLNLSSVTPPLFSPVQANPVIACRTVPVVTSNITPLTTLTTFVLQSGAAMNAHSSARTRSFAPVVSSSIGPATAPVATPIIKCVGNSSVTSFFGPSKASPAGSSLDWNSGSATFNSAVPRKVRSNVVPSKTSMTVSTESRSSRKENTVAIAPAQNSGLKHPGDKGVQQYLGFSKAQQKLATECRYCNAKFDFACLKWLHYTWSDGERCSEMLVKDYYSGNRIQAVMESVKKPGDGSLTNLLKREFQQLCPSSSMETFNCPSLRHKSGDPCRSALCCMWSRDAKNAAFSSFFPCFRCCKVFTILMDFKLHPCFKEPSSALRPLDVPKSVHANSFYPSLSYQGSSALLKCPNCKRTFEFIASLLSHLAASDGCRMIGFVADDLHKLVDGSITAEEEVACDVCSWVAKSRLGYMMHRDHHEIPQSARLQCKKCNVLYSTPCLFYLHRCDEGDRHSTGPTNGTRCCFCEELKNLKVSPLEDEVVQILDGPPNAADVPTEKQQPEASSQNYKDFAASHYVCLGCDPILVLKSFKLHVHFRKFPDHAYKVRHLETFNEFGLILKRVIFNASETKAHF